MVELMMAVAIVAILAAIAIPTYRYYVLKSYRAEALSTLLSMQLAQEKYRTLNASYGNLSQIWSGVSTTSNNKYTLSITNLSGTTYTMTATAIGDQSNDSEGGTSCGTLTLSYANGATTKSPAACWMEN